MGAIPYWTVQTVPGAIDPGTLPHLEIYLSGLNGITPNTNLANLTSWKDQSGNGRDFTQVPGGVIRPVVLTEGMGLAPNVTCISIANNGGNSRIIQNITLPSFTQVRGTTIYMLGNLNVPNNNGLHMGFWPRGSGSGPNIIYQATGFTGGPPGDALWTIGPVPAGNVAIQIGSNGYDTGVVNTPFVWSLWTMVLDLANNLDLYLNGSFVKRVLSGTASYGLSTECDLGGPSAGPGQYGEMASYLLYTATHTAQQISGVHNWYRQHYGIP